MNNIMLFAGNSTESLKKVLEERGSVNVSFAYNNLFANEAVLRNKYHSVDKIVYVYQDESMNVRQDMRVLKSLFIADSFFKSSSILFLVEKNNNYEENIKYFKTTIDEISERANVDKSIICPSFHIVTSEEKFTYDVVYREILGVGESIKVNNTKKKVYRVERGSESNVAFEPGNYGNQSILPYDTSRLNRYTSLTTAALQADSGQLLVDSSDRVIADKTNPEFDRLAYIDIKQKHRIVICSGIAKSGSTTLLIALAASYIHMNYRVLMLDMADQKSLMETLSSYDLLAQEISVKDFLLESRVSQSQSIAVMADIPAKTKQNLLLNLLDNLNRIDTKTILIDIDFKDLAGCLSMLSNLKVDVFVVTSAIERDIETVSRTLENVDNVNVILSNTTPYNGRFEQLVPEEIKRRVRSLNNKTGLLYKPIVFDDMSLDGVLVSTLLGVKE